MDSTAYIYVPTHCKNKTKGLMLQIFLLVYHCTQLAFTIALFSVGINS